MKKRKLQIVTVETSADVNVNEIVKERIENAIKEEVDKCSKEYYRTISVDFSADIK